MTTLCRVCLCGDLRLCSLQNELINIYDLLSNSGFNSCDPRPRVVCYFCHQKLLKCYTFSKTVQRSEDIFNQLFSKGLFEISHETFAEVRIKQQWSVTSTQCNIIINDSTVSVVDEPITKLEQPMTVIEESFAEDCVIVESMSNSTIAEGRKEIQGCIDELKVTGKPQRSPPPARLMAINDKRKPNSHVPIKEEPISVKQESIIEECTGVESEFNNTLTEEDIKSALLIDDDENKFHVSLKEELISVKRERIVEEECADVESEFNNTLTKEDIKIEISFDEATKPHKSLKLSHVNKGIESNVTFECDICSNSYKLKTQLIKHLRKCHFTQYTLTKSKKRYSNTLAEVVIDKGPTGNKLTLNAGEKPFACSLCDKAYRGSDYICNIEEEIRLNPKRKKTRCGKIINSHNKNATQQLEQIDNTAARKSLAHILETPEKTFEETNAISSKQLSQICHESILNDPYFNSDEEAYRSLDNITNMDNAEILQNVSNYLYDCNNDSTNALERIVLETTDLPPKVTRQRCWDRRNFCLYCGNLVTNFTRHLIRNHQEEIEVLKLMSITDPDQKVQKKRRQVITDDLRNRGNFIHNSHVITNNEGCLIPARRKNDEELTHKSPSSFVVCKKCLGTFRRSTFYRHSKKCNSVNGNDVTPKNTLARHALSIIPTFTHASKAFLQNIIPRLRNDEISLIVKQDPLIIAYGCRLLKKKKERRRMKAICSKMRDLAHLLKIVREKQPAIVQLQELIDPQNYECFIEAVKEMSGFNEETGFVKIISVPARVRPEILGCIEILFTNTIMDDSKSTALKDQIKNRLSEFKLLLEANWQWELSSNAENTRKRNLMTKSQVMPLEQDIKKVIIKIHELEEKYYTILKKDTTNVSYENLCEVTIAHIILLDRKRSGDVAAAELQYYLNRKTDEIPLQGLETLDKKQKQAIADLDILQIPGKRGGSVPILLTKVMRRNIDVLIASRSVVKISSDNKYLFASPHTDEPFDGGRCLNKIKSTCNLNKPEMLTSTGLRHQIATISQVHAKTDEYTQHLATFLGHDMHVHANNYRLPIQAIQKGLVGSRLLEIEKLSKTQNDSNDNQSKSDVSDSCIEDNQNDKKRHSEETEGGQCGKENEDNMCDNQNDTKRHNEETEGDQNGKENEDNKCEYENECDGELNSLGINNKNDKTSGNYESNNKSELNKNTEYHEQKESGNCNEKRREKGKLPIKKKTTDNSDDYVDNKTDKSNKRKMTKKVPRLQSSDSESSIDIPIKIKKVKKILTDYESDGEVTEKKRNARNKWTTAEINAVMKHLKKFITLKKNPGKAMCEEVLRKEPVLHKRTWMQINTYINNIYKKNL